MQKILRNVDIEDLGFHRAEGMESIFHIGDFWVMLDKSKNHVVQLWGCYPDHYKPLENHIPMYTLEEIQRRYSSVTGKELFYNPWRPS